MAEIERLFQEAVREEIARHHAAGRPVFQEIDGYLVAIYPDGRVAKLKKLENPSTRSGTGDADHDDSRRTERRRKVNAR